jgi:hypothetical protein
MICDTYQLQPAVFNQEVYNIRLNTTWTDDNYRQLPTTQTYDNCHQP